MEGPAKAPTLKSELFGRKVQYRVKLLWCVLAYIQRNPFGIFVCAKYDRYLESCLPATRLGVFFFAMFLFRTEVFYVLLFILTSRSLTGHFFFLGTLCDFLLRSFAARFSAMTVIIRGLVTFLWELR